MNANAEKWVAALESGDYEQGKAALCRVDTNGEKTWCCLGVATDLYQREVGGLSESLVAYAESEHGSRVIFGVDNRQDSACLLPEVKDWLGLVSIAGTYNVRGMALTTDNDCGKTFAEIAETIRTNPSLFSE